MSGGARVPRPKFRRAYRWIADRAIHAPYRDIEFGPPIVAARGEGKVELRRESGYCSFLLLPLLTLLTSRRLLVVGAPGRGKTTVATLMALLSGATPDEVRRAVQHGHPQLTIADLLGSPLPGVLVGAEVEDVRVAWRKWIVGRVKIIDEYNRIPTKTQSALLSLMAEGYAEMYEQVVHCGRSAWFLTANDDGGGGNLPVIEALKDRIDAVVRTAPFHSTGLDALIDRIASDRSPQDTVPSELVFGPEELDQADREARAIPVPAEVRDALGFLLGQLDFCRRASDRPEYQNKDTLHLAGRRLGQVCNEDCPLDKHTNLCSQTENGVSARAYQSLIHLAKALAYFRGRAAVGVEDLRALAPWVLFDKLRPNPHGAFFQKAENQGLLADRVSWVHQLFDRALAQHAAYEPARRAIVTLRSEAEDGLADPSTAGLGARQEAVRRQIEELLRKNEYNGPVHADLVALKDLHDRYQERIDAAGGGPMRGPFEALIDREGFEGQKRHASWDVARFERLMRGPAADLHDRLLGRRHADETLAAYAMLLREALGSGYLGETRSAADPEGGPWPNFLAFALLKLVPDALADEPDADRLARLADLWNIGEGLLSSPSWVDRYLLACSANLRRVGDVEGFVTETLAPALAPSEPASWSGPFSVSTLDARPVLDGFLPGEMVLAAPRILCVQDRRDPGQHLGVLLGHGGQSRWLGPTPALETYVEEGAVPSLGVVGARAKVGPHRVDLPLIGEPHRMAIARCGFVVVSALDSQRLWIVETP